MKLTNANLRARIDGTLDSVMMTSLGISWTRGVIRKIGIERQCGSRYLLVGVSDVERYRAQNVWQLEPEWLPGMFTDPSGNERLDFSSILLDEEAAVAIEERLTIVRHGLRYALSFPGRPSVSAITANNPVTGALVHSYFASDASRELLRDTGHSFAL
ncbi:MAG: hypothetical protein EOO17_06315 [Chloroflexi bacterium]|nr:MAG: hypothetical protein EOO17_06315 [Chloroflexota bacterium]